MLRDIVITEEQVELVREAGQMYVECHEHAGVPAQKQPTEWHEGQKLLALADSLERLLRLKIRRR